MINNSDIKIEILRYPTQQDWNRCKELALNTVGKKMVNTPDTEWKYKILKSHHSPIRTLMFTIKMYIPYCNSVHFVRHKYGVEHYVTSQRNDRQNNYDRDEAKQSEFVTHIMDINAEELMFMISKRLCGQADERTRYIAKKIRDAVIKTNPEFEAFLHTPCYLTKTCNEFSPCNKINK